MDRLVHQLSESEGPRICGEKLSLADVYICPTFDSLEYLDKAYFWTAQLTLCPWVDLIKARPSFQGSVPPFDNPMWGPKKEVTANPVDPDDTGNRFPVGGSLQFAHG